jgi:hypothetical protein
MSTNIISFEAYKPTVAAVKAAQDRNNALLGGVGSGSFPVMSIKGKVFTLVKDKERKVIMRPDDDDTPAAAIEVVMLAANPHLSKVYYKGDFEEGNTGKPDCMSNDGIAPDAQVENPVSKTCAVCPKNVWGSGRNGKGKACQDSRRLAISSPSQLNEPMLLRVPPASLKSLAEFGKTLSNRGLSFDQVLTKLRFDKDEATPKLVFIPVGVLPQTMQDEVQDLAKTEIVLQIIGTMALPHLSDDDEAFETKPAAKRVSDDDEGRDTAPTTTAKAVAKPKANPAVVEDDDEPAPKTKPKAKPVVSDDDDLDSQLGAIFDDA